MATNLMSNYRQPNESDLVQDLVEEAIEQRGFDVHYMVRDKINPDYLLGESTISEFKDFHIMPMFLESMEHFNGSGDLYDQMGMSYTDSAILQVGARKFMQTLNDNDYRRPREGDLVYIPFSESLWEITKVKRDLQYYQMGKNYSYRLICKLFTYSYEDIESNTGDMDFSDLAIAEQLGITIDMPDANHQNYANEGALGGPLSFGTQGERTAPKEPVIDKRKRVVKGLKKSDARDNTSVFNDEKNSFNTFDPNDPFNF